MWILNLSGLLENSDDDNKLVWLEPNCEYTLGRAISSDIRIDKKYISSNHLIFKIGASDDITNSNATPLTVILESKGTTYIDNVRYRQNDTTDTLRPRSFEVARSNINFMFKKSDEQINVSVNWVPITISYNPVKEQTINNPTLSVEELLHNVSKKFDLRISQGVRSTTDYYLDTPQHSNIANLSYSLLNLLPVISERLLWKLLEDYELIKKDFKNFPDLNEFVPSQDLTVKQSRKSFFKNILFVTADTTSAEYYKPVIETAGGVLKVLPGSNLEKWVSFIEEKLKSQQIVVIQFLSFEKLKSLNDTAETVNLRLLDELCAKIDKKLCRGDDFLQAVIKVDIGLLFGTYNKRKSSGMVEGSFKRRRRLPGSQVKRIDPMSLFVGSQNIEDSHDSIALADNKKKSGRTRVEKIDSMQFLNELESEPIIPSQHIQEDIVMDSEPETPLLQSQKTKKEPVVYDIDVQKLKKEVEEEIAREELQNKKLISTSTRSSKSFIEAIKKIKTDKKLVEKEQESLVNPNDINIQDLIIVETFDLQPPRQKSNVVQDNAWDPKWNGRKNFKNFQKILPRYKQQHKSNPMLSTTINYMALEEYNPDKGDDEDENYFAKTRQKDEEKYQQLYGAENSQRKEVENVFDDPIRLHKKHHVSLFVENDEDEEDDRGTFNEFRSQVRSQPNTQQRRATTSNTYIDSDADMEEHDEEEEDEGRGIKFRFTRR